MDCAAAASNGQPADGRNDGRVRFLHCRYHGLSERCRGGGHLFVVLDDAAVELAQLETPLDLVARDLRCLAPGAVARRVEINPGEEAVPRLGIQSYVVMAFDQHADKFARVGGEFPGWQQMQITFQSAHTHKGSQRHITGVEDAAEFAEEFLPLTANEASRRVHRRDRRRTLLGLGAGRAEPTGCLRHRRGNSRNTDRAPVAPRARS